MTDIEKLAALRVGKADDNKDVKPVDLLRAMIHDIESGELKCDGLLLVWLDRPEEGNWDYGVYRSNVTRIEELAWYRLLEWSHLHRWTGR